MRIEVTTAAFAPIAELAAFESRNLQSGAVASFVGRCRPMSNGAAVHSLTLEHYPGFTEKTIAAFAQSIATRMQLRDALIVHRVGAIAPGEPIVLVAVASEHRASAFRAVEELMDFLKTDAPIWKREVTSRGAAWVEPTPSDHQRRASRAAT
jgi:molybdopterin synthase catalytic subunit